MNSHLLPRLHLRLHLRLRTRAWAWAFPLFFALCALHGLPEQFANGAVVPTGTAGATGKTTTTVKYDKTGRFVEGRAKVKLSEKWGFIDETGKVVIPIKYYPKNGSSAGRICVRF
ncbi:MAG: WG repeat-containing protein [Puniceicoccales bacterium]|jgi:hypothetical protein|nr:WG repeat-containing protein [Puniceicoccales bacterium]